MPLDLPKGTTHIFINTKNKKSQYKSCKDGSWEIYNKGLQLWERVKDMSLALIPISVYKESSESSPIEDITETTVSVTSFKIKKENKSIPEEFVKPSLIPSDFENMYKIFSKYSGKNPLGFIPRETNYYIFYCYVDNKWKYSTSTNGEILTLYTNKLDVVLKVIEDLNSLHLT